MPSERIWKMSPLYFDEEVFGERQVRVEALVQLVQIARREERAVDDGLAGQQRRFVGDALGDEVVEVIAVEVVR